MYTVHTRESRWTQTLSRVWLAPCPVLAETLLRAVGTPVPARTSDLVTQQPREAGVAAADVGLCAESVETRVLLALGLAEVVLVGRVALAAAGVVHDPRDVLRLVPGDHLRCPLGASGKCKELFVCCASVVNLKKKNPG